MKIRMKKAGLHIEWDMKGREVGLEPDVGQGGGRNRYKMTILVRLIEVDWSAQVIFIEDR